jgi:MoxR-like ATPase
MSETNTLFNRLSQTLGKVIVGQSTLVQQLLIALLSGGTSLLREYRGREKP